jgi:hypothetical protein
MKFPQFDIFSGIPGKDAVWLEAVYGLVQARDRMTEHAMNQPGPYFVFCQQTRRVLASVDTTASKGKQKSA